MYITVAHDQGGGEKPTVKPSEQLPGGCGGVYENYSHRGAGSSPLSDSPGP